MSMRNYIYCGPIVQVPESITIDMEKYFDDINEKLWCPDDVKEINKDYILLPNDNRWIKGTTEFSNGPVGCFESDFEQEFEKFCEYFKKEIDMLDGAGVIKWCVVSYYL